VQETYHAAEKRAFSAQKADKVELSALVIALGAKC
jgi:hypothetical protein